MSEHGRWLENLEDGVKAKRTKELTVQILSCDVSGKAQKYTRMGPRVLVPLEQSVKYLLENIKMAC